MGRDIVALSARARPPNIRPSYHPVARTEIGSWRSSSNPRRATPRLVLREQPSQRHGRHAGHPNSHYTNAYYSPSSLWRLVVALRSARRTRNPLNGRHDFFPCLSEDKKACRDSGALAVRSCAPRSDFPAGSTSAVDATPEPLRVIPRHRGDGSEARYLT
jgi:hypothetical protein